jgi:hypothetical protein
MLDSRSFAAGTFEGGAGDQGRQLRWRGILERAAKGADGGTNGADDEDFGCVHGDLQVEWRKSLGRTCRLFHARIAQVSVTDLDIAMKWKTI